MAHELTLPKLGLTMESGKILQWHKSEGDWVEKGEITYTMETEKITYDVEADGAGLLHILVEIEIDLPVAALVGYLASNKDEYQELLSKPPEKTPLAAAAEAPAPAAAPSAPAVTAPPKGRVKISPAARKMAEEKGVDINTIAGTGPGGTIQKEDVLKALEKPKPPAVAPPTPTGAVPLKRVREKAPLRGVRKIISERMHASLQQMAQMTAFGKVDVSELVKFRENLVAQEDKLGVRITFTDIFVKILAVILKEIPIFNASIQEGQIVFWEDINIGIAVGLEDGLIVPVVQGAGEKSIVELAKKRQELVEKARSKSLLPDDISGGTFTLTNFGTYGGDTETAIINPPEVAIMGVGKIMDEAVVVDGQIVIRPMMSFSFTTDHRLIDGATSGQFRARFKEMIEDPMSTLLPTLR